MGARMTAEEAWDKWEEARDAWQEAVTFAESYSIDDRSATKNIEQMRSAMNFWARQAQALASAESGTPAQNPRVITASFRGTLE